jgi:hypothetical protein
LRDGQSDGDVFLEWLRDGGVRNHSPDDDPAAYAAGDHDAHFDGIARPHAFANPNADSLSDLSLPDSSAGQRHCPSDPDHRALSERDAPEHPHANTDPHTRDRRPNRAPKRFAAALTTDRNVYATPHVPKEIRIRGNVLVRFPDGASPRVVAIGGAIRSQ